MEQSSNLSNSPVMNAAMRPRGGVSKPKREQVPVERILEESGTAMPSTSTSSTSAMRSQIPGISESEFQAMLNEQESLQAQVKTQLDRGDVEDDLISDNEDDVPRTTDGPLAEQSIRQAVYANIGVLDELLANDIRLVRLSKFMSMMENWTFMVNSSENKITSCRGRLDASIVKDALNHLYAFIPEMDCVLLTNCVKEGQRKKAKSTKQQVINRANRAKGAEKK